MRPLLGRQGGFLYNVATLGRLGRLGQSLQSLESLESLEASAQRIREISEPSAQQTIGLEYTNVEAPPKQYRRMHAELRLCSQHEHGRNM